MLRKTKSPVRMEFGRSGGSIITARTDVWRATEAGWEPVATAEFRDALQPREAFDFELKPGSYTCVFQCSALESINGVYKFLLSVADQPTFTGEGDVNTTPAKDDSKQFKDQFVLEVRK